MEVALGLAKARSECLTKGKVDEWQIESNSRLDGTGPAG